MVTSSTAPAGGPAQVTLALAGDVMLGRGIDQILPHPGDPMLREEFIDDARDYVRLAERANGTIASPVDVTWPWGEMLTALDAEQPDARVLNLETSVTRHAAFAPYKAVHYRMNPANLPSLTVARPDVCTLANNHVLDFGVPGLEETLDMLGASGLATAGAGRDVDEARTPASVSLSGGGRLLVFSLGMACSGIPGRWAATSKRPGVDWYPQPTPEHAAELIERVAAHKRDGEVVVASVHWGSNWGYGVPRAQVDFARRLIDGGMDLVHGHSSHHPRPIEVYRGRLILYGCGDLINDYEGISGHEGYRGDLRPVYLASIERATGRLAALRMLVLQARRLRLEWAGEQDTHWLRGVLAEHAGPGDGHLEVESDGVLALR